MKPPNINLQSSVNIQGKYVTQIIHFVGGVKRTYHGIDTESIKQGQYTKMKLKDGSMLVVNDINVLVIEVFPEKILNEN
jgi:hypothetical protein|tara:strand:+ start:127 stop:363 length:237 start_codon:yes stop_codon:yes gene_type:complete